MAVPLTAHEVRLLNTIEERLRRDEPGLDRQLGRPLGRLRRLAWRPSTLVVAVALLTSVTGAGVLLAAAGAPLAGLPAAVAAGALVATFV
ncbi:DUF3040 domain-containing protein [Kitasatospora sp. NPDC049258]|uniref:DUF3040 domain-containing protein n=1 Tax=Kitasatospora sp. NPDC049258 TaxID=3155394 RepID=UPI0034383B2C